MTNDHILNSQPVLYLVNTVDALSARFFSYALDKYEIRPKSDKLVGICYLIMHSLKVEKVYSVLNE